MKRIKELVFFGLKLSKDGIAPTEDKVAALRDAGTPEDKKVLRSFLGLAVFLSTHIPNLATLAEPLWKLTREDVTFAWLKVHEDAFQSIKSNLVTKALAYFNVNWNTEVTVDASQVGLGALLTQTNPENLKEKNLVTCKSRILSETECLDRILDILKLRKRV